MALSISSAFGSELCSISLLSGGHFLSPLLVLIADFVDARIALFPLESLCLG